MAMAKLNPTVLFAMLTGQEIDKVESGILEYLMDVAERIITNYVNDDNFFIIDYQNEVVELASHIYNVQQMNIKSIENGNVKALSNSGRSVTFMSAEEINSIVIPAHIKARLPKPSRVRIW